MTKGRGLHKVLISAGFCVSRAISCFPVATTVASVFYRLAFDEPTRLNVLQIVICHLIQLEHNFSYNKQIKGTFLKKLWCCVGESISR